MKNIIKVLIIIVIGVIVIFGAEYFLYYKKQQQRETQNINNNTQLSTSTGKKDLPVTIKNPQIPNTKGIIEQASVAFSKTKCGEYTQHGDLRVGSTKTDSMMVYGLFGDRCGVSCSYNSITGEVTVGDYHCE